MRKPIALEDRGDDGARRFSPSAGRNKAVIAGELLRLLPEGARVLGIASGTGEHAVEVLKRRADIVWQPSDPDVVSRASQDDWAREAGGRMLPSLDIDVTTDGWEAGMAFDAVFCANMIHIAPWTAAEGLAEGAAAVLKEGGLMLLYGPFLKGAGSAEGNMRFAEDLMRRDPLWGVREVADVKGLFAMRGLNLMETVNLPSNNDLLVFKRGGLT